MLCYPKHNREAKHSLTPIDRRIRANFVNEGVCLKSTSLEVALEAPWLLGSKCYILVAPMISHMIHQVRNMASGPITHVRHSNSICTENATYVALNHSLYVN